MNMVFLVNDLRETGPITRRQVFLISFYTAAIFTLAMMEILTLIAMKAADKTLDLMRTVADSIKELYGRTGEGG
jgi:hypothetical protein